LLLLGTAEGFRPVSTLLYAMAGRQERRAGVDRPLIIELQTWLREQCARLSKTSDTSKAINYSLNR
jgi:hypothetical protein